MSEIKIHWASYLESGDRCKATIRHDKDGSKNIHDADVIVVENHILKKSVMVAFKELIIEVPYNELSKMTNEPKQKTAILFEKYILYEDGSLLNSERNSFLTPSIGTSGYLEYRCSYKNKSKHLTIHRALAKAFIPNPKNKPQVNHKDGNKQNNALSNLEWATVSENGIHAFRTGLCTPHRPVRKIICTKTGKEYESLKQAAMEIGMKYQTLASMINPNHKNPNKTTLIYA